MVDEKLRDGNPHGCGRVMFRDQAGRFTRKESSSEIDQRKADYKRDLMQKRTIIKEKLFEEYIHTFCCRGDASDFVESSRSDSPLVQIFESIVEENIVWEGIAEASNYLITMWKQ